MADQTVFPKRLMLLGSGELGKEVALAAQRLGQHVIAADSYDGAPAMQVADERVVVSMLDADALRAAILAARPDVLIPEVEAIATHVLAEFEAQGIRVSPTAKAAQITMNREMIRELAAQELGLRTAPYAYATTADELRAAADKLGYPCVVKPIMSSSGKGQSVCRTPEDVQIAWDYAMAGARAKNLRVIVEGFIQFDLEITLLTVRTRDGKVHFCDPIGHRQALNAEGFSQAVPGIVDARGDAGGRAQGRARHGGTRDWRAVQGRAWPGRGALWRRVLSCR